MFGQSIIVAMKVRMCEEGTASRTTQPAAGGGPVPGDAEQGGAGRAGRTETVYQFPRAQAATSRALNTRQSELLETV